MFRPEEVEVEHFPGKRSQEVYPVSPLDLGSINEQVEETVHGKEQKNHLAVAGQHGKRQGEDKAVSEACLGGCIQMKCYRVDVCKGVKNTLDNPGNIRNYATHNNPLQRRFFCQQPGQWCLYSDVGQCVGQGGAYE